MAPRFDVLMGHQSLLMDRSSVAGLYSLSDRTAPSAPLVLVILLTFAALVVFQTTWLIPESLFRLVSISMDSYLYYKPPQHLVVASDSPNSPSRLCFKLRMTFLVHARNSAAIS
jgi:hypothetical protein